MNINTHIKQHFFSSATVESIQQITHACRNKFINAEVAGDATGRKASVLYQRDFLPLFNKILPLIIKEIPQVLITLAMPEAIPWFEPGGVTRSLCDMQITKYGQGGYYHTHCDNEAPMIPRIARRIISFVYYYSLSEVRGFLGGNLRLYSSELKEIYDELIPINNMIVYFASATPHEVLPVIVPGNEFVDSRFTLNGWISRPLEEIYYDKAA